MSDIITPDWPAPDSIRAFTTTRNGPGVSALPFYRFNLGARCGDADEAVRQNRKALVSDYGLPSNPQWLHQVHGTDVARIDNPFQAEPLADASVTSKRQQVLAVLTADCLPVLFCNAAGTEIAAAHAGWRGLAAGVLEETVAAMHSAPETVMAWLGPAAGAERYEIGEEVRQAFLAADAQAVSAFTPTRPGHFLIDLYALARIRLQKTGLASIHGGGFCTLSDIRFYSHRREQRTGRMATVIWMS